MDNYLNSYNLGYEEGIKDAYIDFLNNRRRNFIDINELEIMSNLYDIGYIKGYIFFVNYIFNLK